MTWTHGVISLGLIRATLPVPLIWLELRPLLGLLTHCFDQVGINVGLCGVKWEDESKMSDEK